MRVEFGRELLEVGRGEWCGEECLDKRWGKGGSMSWCMKGEVEVTVEKCGEGGCPWDAEGRDVKSVE